MDEDHVLDDEGNKTAKGSKVSHGHLIASILDLLPVIRASQWYQHQWLGLL